MERVDVAETVGFEAAAQSAHLVNRVPSRTSFERFDRGKAGGGVHLGRAAGVEGMKRRHFGPAAIARLQACLTQVPPGAPLAADDPLLPALASRTEVRELTAAQSRDYLVIDRQARLPGYVVIADRQRVVAARDRPATCDDGRFLVLGPAK